MFMSMKKHFPRGQELLDEKIGLGHLFGVLLYTQMLSYFDVVYTAEQ
jgi:hypothetical protein